MVIFIVRCSKIKKGFENKKYLSTYFLKSDPYRHRLFHHLNISSSLEFLELLIEHDTCNNACEHVGHRHTPPDAIGLEIMGKNDQTG